MQYPPRALFPFCCFIAPFRNAAHRLSVGFFLFTVLSLCVFWSACARQGAPAGGPKDTRPPEVDTLASTPNFTTRFNRRKIELKFDEWVVLADQATQIVVSPPLAKRPDVVLKGKTVVLTFDKDEELRPQTTYTINFGTAVRDFRENNPANNLRFVFSTGDFIDSLSFKGVVSDALTGEPVENVAVMLYENQSDSAIVLERPYYFARTDKIGLYEFDNLRAGTFRVVAIEDADQNLRWGGETERIAFLDSTIVLNDSLQKAINLVLFKNRPKFRLTGQNTARYGLAKLGFNTPLDTFEFQIIAPEGISTWAEKTSDSLMLWYDLPGIDTSWSIVFSNPSKEARSGDSVSAKLDTVLVKKLPRSAFLESHRIGFDDAPPPAAPPPARGKSLGAKSPPPKPQVVKTIVQPFSAPAKLAFNYPLSAFDTSRWLLELDTVPLRQFSVSNDSGRLRHLVMATDWQQGKTYSLTLLPGAITDYWGVPNADTLQRIFNVLVEKQLGTIALSLEKLRPGTSYVLQIMNGNTVEAEWAFLADSESKSRSFPQLQVASYSLRLLEDLNGNGRWDTGDYWKKRQPESIFTKKLDPLRANWELEVKFSPETINEKKRKQ